MKKKKRPALWAVITWLLIWQLAAIVVDQPIFFASPIQAAESFFSLMVGKRFWISAFNSTLHVFSGIFLAILFGIPLAMGAHSHQRLREFFAPLMLAIKSVPVVSYVILALICFSSRRISILITFLVVLPVIYANLLSGLDEQDASLEEVTRVFPFRKRDRYRYVVLPQVFPAFMTGFCLSCGMAWKAGAAAEVIGASAGTIGERIGRTKAYLETPQLFAWTFLLILLSVGTEKLGVSVLHRAYSLGQRYHIPKGRRHLGKEAQGEIHVQGLSKSFDGALILPEKNLSLQTGEHLSLMGRSGGGKTTFLRILAGLEKPDEGTVQINRDQIRFCFQEDRLIPHLDALANVGLANPGVPEEKILSLLQEAGLDGALATPAEKLSGGEKRRVALIRAICSDAKILFLDEPFTGLDDARRKDMMKMVKRESQGKTMILSTHSGEEADELTEWMKRF